MNVLHMKYAVEVARLGSLNKAAESLIIAPPNISRSIKELEASLGIKIFFRSAKGMLLTPEGEEFIRHAKDILQAIDRVETYYKQGPAKKQKFSLSAPCSDYIAEALAELSKCMESTSAELCYRETDTQQTLNDLLENRSSLGIVRCAEHEEADLRGLFDRKNLIGERVADIPLLLVMHEDHPLAAQTYIDPPELSAYIEILHTDHYIPLISKQNLDPPKELTERQILTVSRSAQLALLQKNHETFMWSAPTSQKELNRYHLVERVCAGRDRICKDILVYRSDYHLSKTDRLFVSALHRAKQKYL